MKYWYIGGALVTLAAVAAVLLFRRKASQNPQVDGGVRHIVDSHAPKAIQSTKLVSFYCKFSTLDRSQQDSPLAGRIITLHATPEGGSFRLESRSEVYEEGSFIPDEAFFRQLQQLVANHDLARHNGQYYTVSGLLPHFGIKLEVHYASGESIRTTNNQSCFLSLEAIEELVTLFRQR